MRKHAKQYYEKNKTAKPRYYRAFTLAEALIVLGLLGVVAESTIPTLITNVMTKVFTQSATLTLMKIKEGTAQMKVDGVLDGYTNNNTFVDTFQKYVKINKRCASTELVKCFPAKFKTGSGKDVDTTTLIIGTKLGDNNISDNTVGIMLANGTSMLITLRDSAKVGSDCDRIDPFDNTSDTTNCLSFLYDVNGFSGPNIMGRDIGNANATISVCDGIIIGALCIAPSDSSYSPIIEAPFVSAMNQWAGARDKCISLGMRLPTKAELNTIYLNKASLGVFSETAYWSSEAVINNNTAAYIQFFVDSNPFNAGTIVDSGKNGNWGARCVKDR